MSEETTLVIPARVAVELRRALLFDLQAMVEALLEAIKGIERDIGETRHVDITARRTKCQAMADRVETRLAIYELVQSGRAETVVLHGDSRCRLVTEILANYRDSKLERSTGSATPSSPRSMKSVAVVSEFLGHAEAVLGVRPPAAQHAVGL